MTIPVLHLVFHPSAAVDLRRALHTAGRADRVVVLNDDFSFGRIDAPDLASRAQWVETELGYDGWDEIVGKDQAFWAAVLTEDCRRVAWLSRRSARDYAGFLELVWRLGDAPCDVVDLTEFEIMAGTPPSRRLALSLSAVPAQQILDAGLLDSARPLDDDSRDSYRRSWKKLRAEDADLRVLQMDLTLPSAPLTYFDQRILDSAVDGDWPVARFSLEILADLYDDAVLATDEPVLASRVHALIDAGRWPRKI